LPPGAVSADLSRLSLPDEMRSTRVIAQREFPIVRSRVITESPGTRQLSLEAPRDRKDTELRNLRLEQVPINVSLNWLRQLSSTIRVLLLSVAHQLRMSATRKQSL
jgi:hypothetical protein